MNWQEEANRDYERTHLGPRADLWTVLEIPESSEASAARWIANQKMMLEVRNFRGEPDFSLAKARAQHERERVETLKEWEARIDLLADKRRRAAEAPDPVPGPLADSWVDRRVAEGYCVPARGEQVAAMARVIEAQVAEGTDKHSLVSELLKVAPTPHVKRVIEEAAELVAALKGETLTERQDGEPSARKVTATIDELYKDRSNEMCNEVVPDPVADMIAELQS